MLEINNTGLILVDVQGKLADQMVDAPQLFQRLRTLIAGANLLQLPIVWLEQLPEKLGETREEIRDLLTGKPLIKQTFSGLNNAEIASCIEQHGRQNWLIAGIETHICVYQTAAQLLEQNYQVQLVTDAVSSRTEANKNLAISKLEQLGARLTSIEMALFELQQVAEGERFKQLIKLIK